MVAQFLVVGEEARVLHLLLGPAEFEEVVWGIEQQKTKWRNLEKDKFKLTFLPKALEILASVTPELNYEELEANLLRLAKEELVETSGGGKFIEKET